MWVYLRVNEPVAVTWVSLNKSSYTFSGGWQTLQLVATVTPADADNKNVSWNSDNANFTVDQNWLVTCVNNVVGIWHITATTEDWWYTATCTVKAWK